MDIIYKLLAPMRYLKISNRQKRLVDFVIPIIIAILTCLISYFLPKPIALLGDKGMIDSVSGFMQVLTGFYIAALGAIATFPNPNIDSPTDGIPLKLGDKVLSRRQFLSYMFGFLSFVSFILVFFSKIIISAGSNIELLLSSFNPIYFNPLKYLFLFVYAYSISLIMLTTFFGLYYLTEKIHEDKAVFTSKVGDAKDETENKSDF
jgi:hypothetical protein